MIDRRAPLFLTLGLIGVSTLQARTLQVHAMTWPLASLTRTIGGDRLRVVCPLPPGVDPMEYRPDRETVQAMQESDLIVLNGAGVEDWLAQVSLPFLKVVDSTRKVEDRLRRVRTLTHSHGPGGAHTHEGFDGHTWLDPRLAAAQAEAIRRKLNLLDRPGAPGYQERCRKLIHQLEEEAQALEAISFEGIALVASHPTWGYLETGYGWAMAEVLLDPDASPDPEALRRLEERAAAARVLVLFEREPGEAMVQALATVPASWVVMDPMKTGTAIPHYLDVMHANRGRLEAAIAGVGAR